MLRFIFVCMTLVCLSILSIASQYMMNGIKTHKAATADIAVVEPETLPTGPSFEEIYASLPAQEAAGNLEDLNAIETAAGNDEFSAPFTNTAPMALADDVPLATALDNIEP